MSEVYVNLQKRETMETLDVAYDEHKTI